MYQKTPITAMGCLQCSSLCMFVCLFEGYEWVPEVPPLPAKSNPYLESSPYVGIAHSTNFPCRRRYYGLRTLTILSLLHLTLVPDNWLARNFGCLKMPLGWGVWLSHPCGLTCWVFDLMGRSASYTSPPERMVSLVWLGWIHRERILNSKMVS